MKIVLQNLPNRLKDKKKEFKIATAVDLNECLQKVQLHISLYTYLLCNHIINVPLGLLFSPYTYLLIFEYGGYERGSSPRPVRGQHEVKLVVHPHELRDTGSHDVRKMRVMPVNMYCE